MATEYDVIVVGSGPNGLAAAIELQEKGLRVLLIEGHDQPGGGMRSGELTLPGYLHDICSAIHPMAAGSPFFQQLPLEDYGLEYIQPPVLAAHPFDNRPAAVLLNSISETAALLGKDQATYLKFLGPQVTRWPDLAKDVLGPLSFPRHPAELARFGWPALHSAAATAKQFQTVEMKGLWGGMAAHSMLPLNKATTSAIAMVLLINGHLKGWPLPRGGSQRLAGALVSYFLAKGGRLETNWLVKSLKELPSSRAVVLDISPRQLLAIAGDRFSAVYKWQLKRFRYGVGVFKLDWALNGPIPFKDETTRKAGTVHLGGTFTEIARSEYDANHGVHNERPYVLLAQQSVFDDSRAPAGKHTAYAYCHVPNGSVRDMTAIIENQVERFAPGFKDLILKRHAFNTEQLEAYNPNYIGGDINGGRLDLCQLYARPALRISPYTTSAKGIYICSASTPPGGGVHGMSGYHAARKIIKDLF